MMQATLSWSIGALFSPILERAKVRLPSICWAATWWSEDEGEQAGGRRWREVKAFFEQLQLCQQRTGEGENLTRVSVGSYQKVMVMRVAVEKLGLDGRWIE